MKPLCWAFVALSFVACGKDDKPAVLEDGDVVLVRKVVKGDEIRVEKAGREARVRLIGIYAFSAVINDPQIKALSAGGESALDGLAMGAKVKLVLDPGTPRQDSTGRYLAYLDKDGVDVARHLLEDGWVVAYTEFPFGREAEYLAAEGQARASAKNIWGLKSAANLVDGLKREWGSARVARGR
jgi:endonuclease YncB( thermonuclease family)